jgi:hypothetical protein
VLPMAKNRSFPRRIRGAERMDNLHSCCEGVFSNVYLKKESKRDINFFFERKDVFENRTVDTASALRLDTNFSSVLSSTTTHKEEPQRVLIVIMAATSSWINNSSTVTTTSSACRTHNIFLSSNQALMPQVKQLQLPRCCGGSDNLTGSTTTTSSSAAASATDTATATDAPTDATLVLFKFELPRSKSWGYKPNTTTGTTDSPTNQRQMDWVNDRDWIDQLLLQNKSQQQQQQQGLSPLAHEKQVTDFHLPLRDSPSNLFETSFRTQSNESQLDLYKKELLLDNMTFLQTYQVEAACVDGDMDECDDLDDLDLEDDDDNEDVVPGDDGINLLTYVIEYQMPLNDSNKSKGLSSFSSSSRNDSGNNYRRELLLDGCWDDMNRVMTLAQFHHLNSQQEEDDLLSLGDLESNCQDEMQEDSDNDDDEEEDQDSVSIFSDSESSAIYHILGMHSCE